MKNDSAGVNNYTTNEQIVIADECGDSMWDAVLEQEVKKLVTNADSLLNRIVAVQVSDTTGA